MPDIERPLSEQSLPSSFDENDEFYNESGLEKVMRKVKAEPLIPLGCILTVTAFVNAYRAMRRGDHNQVQRMFRARVLAQGFTVAAMVAGGFYYGAERHKERELWKVQQAQSEEEKRLRWIRELEARDAEDKVLQEKLARRRSNKQAAAAAAAASTVSGEVSASEASAASSGGGSAGSPGGWFGLGGKKPETSPATEATVAAESTPTPPPTDKKKDTSQLSTLGDLFGKKGKAEKEDK